jgi:hypothetical protein
MPLFFSSLLTSSRALLVLQASNSLTGVLPENLGSRIYNLAFNDLEGSPNLIPPDDPTVGQVMVRLLLGGNPKLSCPAFFGFYNSLTVLDISNSGLASCDFDGSDDLALPDSLSYFDISNAVRPLRPLVLDSSMLTYLDARNSSLSSVNILRANRLATITLDDNPNLQTSTLIDTLDRAINLQTFSAHRCNLDLSMQSLMYVLQNSNLQTVGLSGNQLSVRYSTLCQRQSGACSH